MNSYECEYSVRVSSFCYDAQVKQVTTSVNKNPVSDLEVPRL